MPGLLAGNVFRVLVVLPQDMYMYAPQSSLNTELLPPAQTITSHPTPLTVFSTHASIDRPIQQVFTELETLGRGFGLKADVFHGGAAYGPQLRALNDGLDILVATPGRFMDHLQRESLSLADVRHVVLDEADEMLNMGFADDIETIFSYVDVSMDVHMFVYKCIC